MTKIPTGLIEWLVNRQHVSATDTEIVRMLCDRMRRPGYLCLSFGDTAWDKELRKQAYRIGIQQHRDNQNLYRNVMTARIA